MAARTGQGARRPAAGSSSALRWDRIRPAPAVLITGPERFLADRAAALLRDLLRDEDPNLEVSDLAADTAALGDLLTLASPSLFGEARLIRVSGVERCTDAFLEEMLAYLQAPADGAVVLLRHGGGVRGTKLLDAIRAGTGGAIEVACPELKGDAEKSDFVSAEFAAAGRRIAPAAVRALVTAFSDDLAELASACRQLIDDVGEDVTVEIVNRYYGGRVEATAFEVVDTAVAGRAGDALVILRHAIASGADPVPIVAAFAAKLRAMAKVVGARGSGAELAGRLGLAPWQVDRARRDVQPWTEDGLATAIEATAAADAAVKGAERDPVFAVERLVRIVAARGRD